MTLRAPSCLLLLPLLIGVLAGCAEKPSEQQGAANEGDTLYAPVDTVPIRIDYTGHENKARGTLATGSCTQWKQRGDSLHARLLVVTERLDRMRATLAMQRDNAQVADSVYMANGDGARAYADLRTFYSLALRSAADTATLRRTENMAMQVLSFPTAEAWRQQCFVHVPRMSAITILSKISTDALLLESGCLHSILKECERSVGGSPFPKGDSV